MGLCTTTITFSNYRQRGTQKFVSWDGALHLYNILYIASYSNTPSKIAGLKFHLAYQTPRSLSMPN